MRMNAESAPNQTDRIHAARKMSSATPAEPITVATIKLRAPHHIPEEGTKDLAAIQRVDRQHVENQQSQVNEPCSL
jgi:hypothetical protein